MNDGLDRRRDRVHERTASRRVSVVIAVDHLRQVDRVPLIEKRLNVSADDMAKSSYDNIAKPVRKRSAKTETLVGVRLQSEQIEAIDAWAAKQAPPMTRPEAIRGMIDAMLHILSKDPGEKPAKKAKIR
ncbi:hypothetical protein IVB30_37980 [Bradyrhizobium sp. 200]|uniref:hypothetical protein n=1 Tax=Bradyrhizobium sp. 200 TaxID=2782665 RepID=UPI001FFFC887|nr:hypothetical protein [Bradyrhizobium sp. 200]UPJ48744.1 hypothetical protein IVB30_37980 [Bradyrhizobium sp. 200]